MYDHPACISLSNALPRYPPHLASGTFISSKI